MPPRSTNRRNTPQSPPKAVAQPAKPTRRSARSQSHEPANDTITVETATRGNKRGQLPDKSALADIAESAAGQLSTYEQDVASVAGGSDAGQTSYTQFQLETKFNREEMIAALADLQDDSNAFISLLGAADEGAVALLHAETDDGLPPAAQRFRGRFSGLLKTFQYSVKPYKDASTDTFINIPNAITSLANATSWEAVDDADRFSEALFQLANVTELLTMTLQPRAASHLEILNTEFPTPFFADFSASWGTQLSDKTVEIALGIRTQYCIDLLYQRINQPDFDPDYTLHNVFYDGAGGLLALELSDEDGTNMRQSCRPLFEQRMHDIHLHFSTEKPHVNFETLEASFSWSDFRAELLQWAMHRATGLNTQISTTGGAKAMQIQLQGGPPVVHISEKKRKSIGDKARQVSELMASIQANKARRETLGIQREELGDVQTEEVQESPIQTGAYEPATNDMGLDDGSGDGNILASQQSMQVLETLRLHAAQSNKENLQAGRKGKFIDRQAGAQRIDLIDDSPTAIGTAGPSNKRGWEVDVDDDASSIQFEDDSRPQVNKRARSDLANDGLVAAATQFAVDARQLSLAASQPLPTRQALPQRHRDQAPPSTAPQMSTEDLPGSQPIPAIQRKGPQVRVPFSMAETTRLIELIENLPEGTARIGWAALEKEDLRHPEGPLLQKRGQVGLKDKARNLKMDFLKARAPVPRNFGLIPLGNRLIDQLDKMGVPHGER